MDQNKYDPEKEFAPKTKKKIFFLFGVLCCLTFIGIIYKMQTYGVFVSKADYDYYKQLEDNYGKYNDILRMIGEDPLVEGNPGVIDDDKLKELVESIGDPYAQYYTTDEYEDYERQLKDEYVGIGISVITDEDKVVVLNVIEGGPAEDVGILAGDIITAVDGTKPKDSTDAVKLIGGEAGGEVVLAIERGGEELVFKMNRTKIDYDSIKYNVLEDNPSVGYIQINAFRENTAKDFKLAVRDLKNAGCDKFIIDLRDNGGGLTAESIEIADYLLPACTIMSEVSKDGTENIEKSKASSADIDFVMLTNSGTASASEILAGAIQDNKAGLIIGEKTYGKGVTQLTRKFKDGSAVKLTITEYFRPSGETVNEKGITPDIEAKDEEIMDVALRELFK